MNVLIVEDERKTADLLQELIESQPDYLVVKTCDSVESSVDYLKKNQAKLDLIFMDIQLADGESFDIFREVEVGIPVIFCTAYDEYILKAFKNNGIDYILKPFKGTDIQQALAKIDKLKLSLSKGLPDPVVLKQIRSDEPVRQKTFLVRHGEKMLPVMVSDIAFLELENEIVHLFNFKGEKHVIFKRLDEIEGSVDPRQFFRINRQMLVNRDAIREIVPYFNRKVIVHLHIQIPNKAVVSRLKVSPFLDWLERPE